MNNITIFVIICLLLLGLPSYSALPAHLPAPVDTTKNTTVRQSSPGDEQKAKGAHDNGFMGIAALGSGIFGLLVGAVIFGSAAIVLGVLALAKKRTKKGFAIAGLILGIFDVVVGIMILAALI